MDTDSIREYVRYGMPITHTLGLFGNHGIGKSSFVKYDLADVIAERHNISVDRVHVIIRCASVMDPADLIGNFREFGGRTFNCPPSWLPTAKSYDDEMAALYEANGDTYSRLTKYDDVYILFIDECRRGNPVIQDGLMELLLDHTLFGVPLHENTYVICADNDNLDIYNGTKRDPAQVSRIKAVQFAPTDKQFLCDFAKRVERGEIHSIIHEFLSQYPEMIVMPSKTIEECSRKNLKCPSPRDWTQFGESLKLYANNGLDVTRIEKKLMEGATTYVGSQYATKFVTWAMTERKAELTADDILNHFDDAMELRVKGLFNENAIVGAPIGNNLLDTIKKMKTLNAHQGANMARFLACCPDEVVASVIKRWMIEMSASYTAWRSTPLRFYLCNAPLLGKEKDSTGTSAYDRWVSAFCKNTGISPDDIKRDDLTVSLRK